MAEERSGSRGLTRGEKGTAYVQRSDALIIRVRGVKGAGLEEALHGRYVAYARELHNVVLGSIGCLAAGDGAELHLAVEHGGGGGRLGGGLDGRAGG